MENKELKQCKEVFKTLCKALEERKWNYDADEEKNLITFGVNGNDIPMDFIVVCDEKSQLVKLVSFLPFNVAEGNRILFTLATALVNFRIIEGNFNFDIMKGNLSFTMTASFMDSLIGADMFHYMIELSCHFVDLYNDKFYSLSKGEMTVEEFFDAITSKE